MKTKILLLLLLIFQELMFAQTLSERGVTIQKDANSYVVSFQLPNYQISTTNIEKSAGEYEKFSLIDIPNYGIVFDDGAPQLPQITFNLAISYDDTNSPTIEILTQSTETKFVENRIYPSQFERETELRSAGAQVLKIDQVAYSKSSYTAKADFVSISEPFVMSGVKGVSVTITPFNYNPQQNKMEVTTAAKFRVEINRPVSMRIAKTASLEQSLKRKFANYSDCQNVDETGSILRSAASSQYPKGNYLIIAPDRYVSTRPLSNFIAHKEALGYNVLTSYYSGCYSGDYLGEYFSIPSRATPDGIKKVILNRYENTATRPEYVLLIGSYEDIGTWIYDVDGIRLPSDFGYTQLDGSDIYADVTLGRWPVSSASEFENIVTKTIEMDNKFMAQEVSPKKAVVVADYDEGWSNNLLYSFQYTAEEIATHLADDGYACQKIYKKKKGTTNDIIDAINNNPYIVVYRGHGAVEAWGGPPFYTSHISSLSNGIYPIIFSIACHTANFTVAGNLGTAMVNSAHGGVAFLGGTELTPHEYNARFCDEIFRDSYPIINNLGKIIDDAKHNLTWMLTSNARRKRLRVAYNLLGDPSLQVRYDGGSDYVITGGKTDMGETVKFPVRTNVEVAGQNMDYIVRGNGTIGANVTINATNSIHFKPGFKVEQGATFHAGIVDASLLSSYDYLQDEISSIDVIDDDLARLSSSIGKNNQGFDIRCYPNPFQDDVSFVLTLEAKAKINISIFDINGVVQKQLLPPTEYPAGTHTLTDNLSWLKTGLYICSISVGDNRNYLKLLKK